MEDKIREIIKEYLEENLTIDISTNNTNYDDDIIINVAVMLGDNRITEASDCISSGMIRSVILK